MASWMPVTRAHAVAGELRRRILVGELPPGTRLRQLDVARELGVSTTPVREAFTSLAREGLIQQDAHRGVFVFAPSEDDVRERYEIRIALEPLAAGLAAKAMSEESLAELEALLAEMKRAVARDKGRYAGELDPRFHVLIAESAGRPRLAELIAGLQDGSGPVSKELHAQHVEIADALRAGAPKRASRAMKAHLEHAQSQL
jgi:DNA-binding GntR family transcriptional regulator